MCAFVDYCLLYTRKTIENDGAGASLDIVDRLLGGEEAYCAWHGETVECLEGAFGCHSEYMGGHVWRDENGCMEAAVMDDVVCLRGAANRRR